MQSLELLTFCCADGGWRDSEFVLEVDRGSEVRSVSFPKQVKLLFKSSRPDKSIHPSSREIGARLPEREGKRERNGPFPMATYNNKKRSMIRCHRIKKDSSHACEVRRRIFHLYEVGHTPKWKSSRWPKIYPSWYILFVCCTLKIRPLSHGKQVQSLSLPFVYGNSVIVEGGGAHAMYQHKSSVTLLCFLYNWDALSHACRKQCCHNYECKGF